MTVIFAYMSYASICSKGMRISHASFLFWGRCWARDLALTTIFRKMQRSTNTVKRRFQVNSFVIVGMINFKCRSVRTGQIFIFVAQNCSQASQQLDGISVEFGSFLQLIISK
jgi:hypothetical protein